MLFTEFGSGINISYSGLCYNGCYDVCFVSYCITDYYDKGGAVGGISIPSAVVKSLDTSVFKVIVLVVWVAICIFIFNYTKFGRREKFVGGNPVCAQLSGIKYNNYAILGF